MSLGRSVVKEGNGADEVSGGRASPRVDDDDMFGRSVVADDGLSVVCFESDCEDEEVPSVVAVV